ncbi:MAG: Ig-like domain-containing protein [Actinobacteria bacterium]|nr:Ig-like domain-containing protein [Actinomycetota bacterium]
MSRRSTVRRTRLAVTAAVPSVVLLGVVLFSHEPSIALLSPARGSSDASIVVESQEGGIPVTEPLRVRAAGGTLVDVEVYGNDGTPLLGTVSDDGSSWQSDSRQLPFGVAYDVQVTAVDAFGSEVTHEEQVTTTNPDGVLKALITPWYSQQIGVGMPITIDFSYPVEDKVAVEQSLTVETSVAVEGAWSWTNDQQISYRPRTFWPGGTRVTVAANLRGVEASPGVFGGEDQEVVFSFFRRQEILVDAKALTLTVVRDGTKIKSFPVTTGRDGLETMSGTTVVLTRERRRVMDTASAGVPKDDPNAYRVKVEYAMRMTWTGEFLHASPWAAADWGKNRTSHGCVSMSTENAKWLFENSEIGDPVTVTGTPKTQKMGDGVTVWNVPWDEWVAGSALN